VVVKKKKETRVWNQGPNDGVMGGGCGNEGYAKYIPVRTLQGGGRRQKPKNRLGGGGRLEGGGGDRRAALRSGAGGNS